MIQNQFQILLITANREQARNRSGLRIECAVISCPRLQLRLWVLWQPEAKSLVMSADRVNVEAVLDDICELCGKSVIIDGPVARYIELDLVSRSARVLCSGKGADPDT